MTTLFNSALFAPIEHLINKLLSQDPAACARLAPHKGKSVAIECTTIAMDMFIVIEQDRLQLRSIYEGQVTSKLKGSSSALLSLLSSNDKSSALFDEGISITGDAELVQEVYGCLAELEIDWENPLGSVIGDVATHQISQLFSHSTQWLKQSNATMRNNIDEYLHEEARLFPGEAEVQNFYQNNQDLKLSADRLSARVQRLCASIEKLES